MTDNGPFVSGPPRDVTNDEGEEQPQVGGWMHGCARVQRVMTPNHGASKGRGQRAHQKTTESLKFARATHGRQTKPGKTLAPTVENSTSRTHTYHNTARTAKKGDRQKSHPTTALTFFPEASSPSEDATTRAGGSRELTRPSLLTRSCHALPEHQNRNKTYLAL